MATQPIKTDYDAAVPVARAANPADQNFEFVVPGMHCAGCLKKVETALDALPQVSYARANLSTKRVKLTANGLATSDVIDALRARGFDAIPFTDAAASSTVDKEGKSLLLALAVAGFGMMNIMLLSVSVWAGVVSDMGEITRTLFHWLSAIIAVPTVAYAGRPFFRSAARALSSRSMNMDVPISLAVVLTTAASLLVTLRGGEHAYFDAAVMLLFFLLIGRFLDQSLRAKAFSAAQTLLGLRAQIAREISNNGIAAEIPIEAVRKGMLLQVLPGERIPVDGCVRSGQSDVDLSLVTGESAPLTAAPDTALYAGTLNMTGALTLEATADIDQSFLSDLIRIMEQAEQSRAPLVRLADRVARIYAPAVHILAAATFLGWLLGGLGWYPALMIAVAVLIITCPCALGLAVPAVQVSAVGRLLKAGIVVKSGDALDRLEQVDTVVFDKTGTLTLGDMQLHSTGAASAEQLDIAAALASHSRHPLAKALTASHTRGVGPLMSDITEHPGDGLSAQVAGTTVKLGRRAWVAPHADFAPAQAPELVFDDGSGQPVVLTFSDILRADTADIVARLRADGKDVILLSGDQPGPVADAAKAAGITRWKAECRPQDKVTYLQELKRDGRTTLMVGDGLNDAPALKAASVSMSLASASDVAQVSADVVFQGALLAPVRASLVLAQGAGRKVRQNVALAIGYNAIAVPLAIAGFVTPLFAALAMSLSSLIVTGNAALLGFGRKDPTSAP